MQMPRASWVERWRVGIRASETALVIGLGASGLASGDVVIAAILLAAGAIVGLLAVWADPARSALAKVVLSLIVGVAFALAGLVTVWRHPPPVRALSAPAASAYAGCVGRVKDASAALLQLIESGKAIQDRWNADKDDRRMQLQYNVWRSEADGILSAYSDLAPNARSQFDSAHGSHWLHSFLFIHDSGRQIGVDLEAKRDVLITANNALVAGRCPRPMTYGVSD
jgi:hypothetical protein